MCQPITNPREFKIEVETIFFKSRIHFFLETKVDAVIYIHIMCIEVKIELWQQKIKFRLAKSDLTRLRLIELKLNPGLVP